MQILNQAQYKQLKTILKLHEGLSLKKYYLLGKPHIGFGYLLKEGDNMEEISPYTAEILLDACINVAIDDYVKFFGKVNEFISIERKLVLIEKCYIFGSGERGQAFEQFIKAVNALDWKKARHEMLDSHWYRNECPARALRMANSLYQGQKNV